MKFHISWLSLPAILAILVVSLICLIVSAINAPNRAKASAEELVSNIEEVVRRDGVAPFDPCSAGAEFYDGQLFYDGYRITYKAIGPVFSITLVVDDETIITYESSTRQWSSKQLAD